MYDELVKQLRFCAATDVSESPYPCDGCSYDNPNDYGLGNASNVLGCSARMMLQAADAIEELCGLCADQSKDCSEAVAKYLELWEKQPRWIPVSERKPKTDDIVIVAIHDDSGDTPYDVTNVGFYLDVFPLGIWVVENERCNYVTHWMRLPEPPKEG